MSTAASSANCWLNQEVIVGILGNQLQHSCSFGKNGIGQPRGQFLGRLFGPAEKVQQGKAQNLPARCRIFPIGVATASS
jgi:hypothetical protein